MPVVIDVSAAVLQHMYHTYGILVGIDILIRTVDSLTVSVTSTF